MVTMTRPIIILFFICMITQLVAKSTVPEDLLDEKEYDNYIYNDAYKVFYPADYPRGQPKKKIYKHKDVNLYLYAKKFSQGNAIYAEIIKSDEAVHDTIRPYRFSFEDAEVPLVYREWGARALFAIPPDIKPGTKVVTLQYFINGRDETVVARLNIKRTKFPYTRVAMDLGKYSDVDEQKKPEVIAFIRESIKKKEDAYESSQPELLNEKVAHPRNLHYITSHFWEKRIMKRFQWKNGKKIHLKNRVKIHRGLDLRGAKGEPVYAMADGLVVLADTLYFEGNMIIIDHGNKMFSYYMHLDKIKTRKGSYVRAGQLIGTVGDSGRSTASHLHVSFKIRDVQVDPLSILVLPLR